MSSSRPGALRWLAPSSSARELARQCAGGARFVAFERRGVHHGHLRANARVQLTDEAASRRWRRDQPIFLPGILREDCRAARAAIEDSRRLFERLRVGHSFQDAVWKRLGRRSAFAPAGVTVDLGDTREIEKVFVHALAPGRAQRVLARDLYAKLSWIAHDERDLSLRVRFSFGSEQLLEWIGNPQRAAHSDRYAQALFPECKLISANQELRVKLESWVGGPLRFSERIVYNNAPGGGAIFHHDDETDQHGVVFGQLAGSTGWLALPKRELAELVVQAARGKLRTSARSARRVLQLLDRDDQSQLVRLLNSSPHFSRRLAEHGACFELRPGDALVLPSHGPDDTCWHAVFALGRRASLAHSYGIFRAGGGRSGGRGSQGGRARDG